MSREHVEVITRGLEVFEAEGLDSWLERFVAPDAVFIQEASVVPDAQTWFGWAAGQAGRKVAAHRRLTNPVDAFRAVGLPE